MPNVAGGKEKTLHVALGNHPLEKADPKDVAKEPLPPQKVLKIFSINIIAQGLPFCRRRVSFVCICQPYILSSVLRRNPKSVKGRSSISPPFTRAVVCSLIFYQNSKLIVNL